MASRGTVFLSIICVFASALISAEAHSEMRSIRVASGKSTIVSQPQEADEKCRSKNVRVTLTRKPDHGDVLISSAEVKAGDFGGGHVQSGGVGACEGKMIKAKRVSYKSDKNFKGMDHFGFQVTSEGGTTGEVEYDVTVF